MKRGLVIEGGGMRGAHSAGVLSELARHGPLHFDVICGSSAGSCTTAFWVAEQYTLFEKVWGDYLHDDLFIRYRNVLSTAPVMNLDYLIDHVFVREVPLDVNAIRQTTKDFFITATHCGTGKEHYFHNKKTERILLALKAGAAMPLAYPIPVWVDGEPFADGGIADSIPIQKAVAEGCDEIWVLLTQPPGYAKRRLSALPWPRWVYRKYPALAEAMLTRHQRYNESLELTAHLEQEGRARVIRPSRPLAISRLSRRRDKILAAMAEGKRDCANFLARQ